MGSFDVVRASAECPGCGQSCEWRVQYAFGYCRYHEYRLGEPICWFDPPGRVAPLEDHGTNGGGLVAVRGFVEKGCSSCGQGTGAVVRFRDNVVCGVEITLSDEGCDIETLAPPSVWTYVESRRLAGSANEDRLAVACRGDRWTVVVADGAGGISGGAAAAIAATNAMAALGAENELDADGWCASLVRLDRELLADPTCGETTVVVVQMREGELWGASVGDSSAVLVEHGDLVDLTAEQSRKPLLGSGAARPTRIRRQPLVGRLLVATDGLSKYATPATLVERATASTLASAVDGLVRAVTLPSGNLHDDVAVVLVERGAPSRGARG